MSNERKAHIPRDVFFVGSTAYIKLKNTGGGIAVRREVVDRMQKGKRIFFEINPDEPHKVREITKID